MPILQEEPTLFPDNLFDGTFDGEEWFGIYTKARCEKAVARLLCVWQEHFYLPLVRLKHTIRRKVVVAYEPLFAGYLFVKGEQARVAALKTNRISQILPVKDVEQLYLDLKDTWLLYEAGVNVYHEQALYPGRPVRICKGCLKGIEGVLVEIRGSERFVVAVTFMNQGSSIEALPGNIEPLMS